MGLTELLLAVLALVTAVGGFFAGGRVYERRGERKGRALEREDAARRSLESYRDTSERIDAADSDPLVPDARAFLHRRQLDRQRGDGER